MRIECFQESVTDDDGDDVDCVDIWILISIVLFLICLVLQRLLGSDVGPNKVQEIKTDSLGNLPVMCRDEGMVLYGPAVGQMDRKIQYEIVLNRPCADNLNTAYR